MQNVMTASSAAVAKVRVVASRKKCALKTRACVLVYVLRAGMALTARQVARTAFSQLPKCCEICMSVAVSYANVLPIFICVLVIG